MSFIPPELARVFELLLVPSIWITSLALTFRILPAILFASIGETITERSGVVNLGIEGFMLLGAVSGVIVSMATGDPWIGIASAMAVALLVGVVYSVLVVYVGVNQAIIGLSLWLTFLGLSDVLFTNFIRSNQELAAQGIPKVRGLIDPADLAEAIGSRELAGLISSIANPLVVLSLALVPATWFLLNKTLYGVKIRAVGEDPRAADAAGVNVYRVRMAATLIGCVLAALSGAYLTLVYLGDFRFNVTAGRGFIALAMVYFGNWNPIKVAVPVFLYSLIDALQIAITSSDLSLARRYYIFNMIPYLFIIALIPILGRMARAPSALMKHYRKP